MNLNNRCFFCSEIINKGEMSKEHIVPDWLLGDLNLKKEQLSSHRSKQEYAKIKVPAHRKCNSEFASQYESKVKELLSNLDELYDELVKSEHEIKNNYGLRSDIEAIISTWLMKLFYGNYYYDYLYRKDEGEEWKEMCYRIISDKNFDLIQKAYQSGQGFYLPSSLFVFKDNNTDNNFRFDFETSPVPAFVLLKIKNITFLLLICDGFLTRSYIDQEGLQSLKQDCLLSEMSPSYLRFCSYPLALRSCIPKSPSFIFCENQILNTSCLTAVNDPGDHYSVNPEEVNNKADLFLAKLTEMRLNRS